MPSRLASRSGHRLSTPALPQSQRQPAVNAGMYFEVYRAPFVRLTSTLSGGGDWRWRFCRPGGIVVAASQGYPTETECRHSIAMLACGAANAVVRDVFRSEEHTSELQPLMRISYAVFCLKKKKNKDVRVHH